MKYLYTVNHNGTYYKPGEEVPEIEDVKEDSPVEEKENAADEEEKEENTTEQKQAKRKSLQKGV